MRIVESLNRLIVAVVLAGVLAFPAAAATKMRLHNTPSAIAGYKCLDLALGPAGRANINTVTTSTASGTDIQLTDTAGGTVLKWISEPLSAGVTISGSVIANLYGGESATTVNAAFRVRLYKYSGGSEGAAILTSDMSSELNATLTTARIWSNAPTSTAYSAGDRIVVKFFLTNVGGTMGAGTCTGHYEGATDAADGSSWVQFGESVTFNPEGGAGSFPVDPIVQWGATPDMGNTGQQLGAGGLITVPLHNATLSGNGLLIVVRCGTAATTLTPTNTGTSDAWVEGPGARDASISGYSLMSFICPNTTVGTRTIQIKTSAAMDYFKVIFWEVRGMALASVLDGSSIAMNGNGTSPMTAGSFTPTSSGDLLFQFVCNTPSYLDVTNWVPGTVGSPNITWRMLSSGNHDALGGQFGIYNSTAAINPSLGVGGTNATGLSSLAFAVKSSASGTARTGMHIYGLDNTTIQIGERTNWTFQFPSDGNLKFMATSAGGNMDLTAPPIDSTGDAWLACGQRSDGSLNSTRIYYAANATSNNVTYLRLTNNNNSSDVVVFFGSIKGAAPSPFITNDYIISTGNKSGTTPLTVFTPTPSSASGIFIGLTAWDFDTATNSTWDRLMGYLPVNSTGNTAFYENNGIASWTVTSTTPQALTWTFMDGLGVDVGFWASSGAFFSAPAAGGGGAPAPAPRRRWVFQ